jgi:hypothetical protein
LEERGEPNGMCPPPNSEGARGSVPPTGEGLEAVMFYLQIGAFLSGGTRIRTGDTMIFSHVLYQLSYPAGG